MPWLWVAVGGAAGAVSRYGLGLAVIRVWGSSLPLATVAVNLIGSFVIGLAVPLLLARPGASEALRLALAVGFLGSFTTFSTFSLDTLALLETGRTGWALANALGSVALGLACVALGVWLGRQFM